MRALHAVVCCALLTQASSEETVNDKDKEPVESQPPPFQRSRLERKYSFSNPFSQYTNGVIPGWEYGGESMLANDYVALTPAAQNKVGWIWSTEPMTMTSWEVLMEFHIGGTTDRGAGSGMAFWIVDQHGKTGSIYGHHEDYNGLGIFFDTYEGDNKEETESFVVAMMNYGEKLGTGENPDYFHNQVGVCFAGYRNLPHPVRARIIYSNKQLQVLLDLDNTGRYQSCIQTEAGDERLKLPPKGYFGVTASTGQHGDTHVVYNFIVANLEGVESPNVKMAGADEHPAHEVHKEGHHGETHVPVSREDVNTPEHLHDNEEHHRAVAPTPVAPSEVDSEDIVRRISLQLSEVASNLRGSQVQMAESIVHLEHNIYDQLPAAGSANAKALRESMGEDLRRIETRFEEIAHVAQSAKEAAESAHHEVTTMVQNNARLTTKLDEVAEQMTRLEKSCMSSRVKQEQAIGHLKTNVAELTQNNDKVTSHISTTVDAVHANIRESGKMGFWSYFACVQLLCVGAFLYWKASKDYNKRDKLI